MLANFMKQFHVVEFSTTLDKNAMLNSFSIGETLILNEGMLIAIPYFGDIYSMIVTLESEDGLVDGIDASHILSMLVIFDWYMTDSEYVEYGEVDVTLENTLSDKPEQKSDNVEIGKN